MANEDGPKTKYVLECVGLMVTTLAAVVGMYVSLRPSAPAEPAPVAAAPVAPVESPAPKPASQPQPQPRQLASAAAPSFRISPTPAPAPAPSEPPTTPAEPPATVNLDQIQGVAEVLAYQQQNTDRIAQLVKSFPQAVTTTTATVTGYNADSGECLVDVVLRFDPARYQEFLAGLQPLLDIDSQLVDRLRPNPTPSPPSAELSLVAGQERNGPYFEFGKTATSGARAILDPLAQNKTPQGKAAFPQVIAAAWPTASGTAQPGDELTARLWRVTRDTGALLQDRLLSTKDLKFRVTVQDAAGSAIARQTLLLGDPYANSWDPRRFVAPALLAGDRISLKRGRLAPMAAMRHAYKDDHECHRLLGLMPGFCSPRLRIMGKQKTEQAEFTAEVTYRLSLPMTVDVAGRIASCTATLLE